MSLPIEILEFSETRGEIAKAIVKAQRACGIVLKDASNPAFKSTYASLAAVLSAVRDAFLDAGIAILQPPGASYEDGLTRVTTETTLLHESGEWARAYLTLQPTKSDPQAVGSAATYGRRYQLLGLSNVAPDDDDGSAASHRGADANAAAAEIALLRETIVEAAKAVAFTSKRILSRSVPVEWQVAKTAEISKGRTKIWGELSSDEMLALFKAIDVDFPRPVSDAEKPAQDAPTAETAPEAAAPVETSSQGDLRGAALDPVERARRELIAWLETRVSGTGRPEDEMQSLAEAIRNETIASGGEYPTTYSWRALTESELREFWKRLPKKPRETAPTNANDPVPA